jgi:hypothetical protein
MKGVFIFKIKVYQKSEMRFALSVYTFHFTNIFYKSIFTTYLLVFKNSINGENLSLVLFLSLKIMGILPKVYKIVCVYFLSRNPAWL